VMAMRAVIQRVKSASVEVEGKIVSRIGQGWLCLVSWLFGRAESTAELSQRVRIAPSLSTCVLVPLPTAAAGWAHKR
jgi:hypothetical protein